MSYNQLKSDFEKTLDILNNINTEALSDELKSAIQDVNTEYTHYFQNYIEEMATVITDNNLELPC